MRIIDFKPYLEQVPEEKKENKLVNFLIYTLVFMAWVWMVTV